ncbi:MAG TPA: hypothetical protein VHB48_06055 [Chitinophagaceae bacterium]|nr:hypothetical protein [Chitinophagaceae bacterium]
MAYKISPGKLKEKWKAFCAQCDEHIEPVRYRGTVVQLPKRLIYSIDSFCCFAGLEENDLAALERNKNYAATVRLIRYTVLARKLEALVNGEGSTSGLIFDLKCNYGLHPTKKEDTQDWHITMNLGADDMDAPQPTVNAAEEVRKWKEQQEKQHQPTAAPPAAPPKSPSNYISFI